MKARLDNIELEGTPEECAAFMRYLKATSSIPPRIQPEEPEGEHPPVSLTLADINTNEKAQIRAILKRKEAVRLEQGREKMKSKTPTPKYLACSNCQYYPFCRILFAVNRIDNENGFIKYGKKNKYQYIAEMCKFYEVDDHA